MSNDKTSGKCSRTASMLCGSGPGAPRFAATWRNAISSRSQILPIIADVTVPALLFDFGATSGPEAGMPATSSPWSLWAFARGASAVSKVNWSRNVCCLTGVAFPRHGFAGAAVVGPDFRRVWGTMASGRN